ncbi:genetic suppressor element 1-like isoform X2 [Limulus polyphemus]|uniref:Genetic suppressor element 1-like isoform X2 n=1 Tax=Limulus polyphemus TaxID=6850 RepID=A0ABM1T3D2_LIMPO|nr:genetic suppressor element 1-like isoform X2 [Limulus polyphemus]
MSLNLNRSFLGGRTDGQHYYHPLVFSDHVSFTELPHGPKTPSLTMHVRPKSNVQAMAAVSSFHPGQHSNMIGHLSGSNNSALNATRTSSFAAALRKLAKQAVDPVLEKDLVSNTPASSPAVVSTSGTPKHMFTAPYLSSNGPTTSTAPSPAITISHTPSQLALSLETRNRADVSRLGYLVVDSKVAQSEKRYDSYLRSKDHQVVSHLRSESVGNPPDAGRPSISGFQPYRSVSDVSHSHPSLYDHHHLPLLPAPYPYHTPFLPPSHFPHVAYGLKDSSYLDHCGIVRSPMWSFLPAPGMVSRTNMPFVPDRPYPSEILGHSLGLVSPGVSVLNHESFRVLQEERLQERERELVQEKKWDQERDQIRDQDIIQSQEVTESTEERSSTSRSPLISSKNEPVGTYRSFTQGTPRDLVIKWPPQETVTSSTPLNLTTYSTGLKEHKEMATYPERDMPEGLGYKHPLLLNQDIERNLPLPCSQATKEIDKYFRKKAEKSIAKSLIEVQDSRSSGSTRLQKKLQNTITDTRSSNNTIYDYCTKNIAGRNGTKKGTCINGDLKDPHDTMRDLLPGKPKHILWNKVDINYTLSEDDKRCIDLKTCSEPNKTPSGLKLLNTCNYNYHFTPTHPSRVTVNSEKKEVCGVIIENGNSPRQSMSAHDRNDTRDTVCNLPPRVVSKLDMEETKLKKVRLDGTYQSDINDSDVEEGYLFLIKSGPPLKLDLNPKKLQFLKVLGLTTHQKRRERDLEKLLKRSKIFHQKIVTPLLLESQVPTSGLNEVGTSVKPDDLRKEETYPQKAEFLTFFRLLPTTSQKVDEVEKTWRMVKSEREKRKRKYWERGEKKRCVSTVSSQKEEGRVGSIKLGYRDKNETTNLTFELEGPFPSIKKPGNVHLPVNTLSQNRSSAGTLDNSSEEEATLKVCRTRLCPLSHKDRPAESPSTSGLNTSVSLTHNPEDSKLVEMDFVTHNPEDSKLVEMDFVTHNPEDSKLVEMDFVTHNLRGCNHVEMNFVQQFHKSVLHATKLQLDQKQLHYTEESKRLKKNPVVTLSTATDNVENSGRLERTEMRRKKNDSWPGVEAILEAYEHHLAEQKSEKEFLTERCQELSLRNQEFNSQVERMHQQLKELLSLKHHLQEDRQHYQNTVDKLKKCLHQLR